MGIFQGFFFWGGGLCMKNINLDTFSNNTNKHYPTCRNDDDDNPVVVQIIKVHLETIF